MVSTNPGAMPARTTRPRRGSGPSQGRGTGRLASWGRQESPALGHDKGTTDSETLDPQGLRADVWSAAPRACPPPSPAQREGTPAQARTYGEQRQEKDEPKAQLRTYGEQHQRQKDEPGAQLPCHDDRDDKTGHVPALGGRDALGGEEQAPGEQQTDARRKDEPRRDRPRRCQLAAPPSSRETYRGEDQRRQDRETTEPDRCQEPEPRAALPGRGLPLGTFDQLVVSAVLGDALVACRDRPALPRLNKAAGHGARDEGRHGLKCDAHGESRIPLVRHELD